jgi:MFS family permease
MDDLREGLAYLRHAPALLLILGLLGMAAMFTLNFSVLMPIMARDVLHTGAEGLGTMWTAFGLGAVAGSLTVVRWSRSAVGGPLLLVTALVAGLSVVGLAAAHTILLTLAGLVVVGWSTAALTAGSNSAVQARVDDDVRGRVLSVYSMILSGTGPPGGLVAAGLASLGGAPLSLAVGGGVCVAGTLAMAPFFLTRLRASGERRGRSDSAPERRSGRYSSVASKTDRAG